MKVPTCTRRLQFCAGHRVMGHENKCAHLHGHNYVAEITARVESLDGIGRVIDFSVLKERVGGWIERYWDHGFIVNDADGCAHLAIAQFQSAMRRSTEPEWSQKTYLLPGNPTAENMAEFLLRVVSPEVLKGTGVEVCHVKLYETENCWAEASL